MERRSDFSLILLSATTFVGGLALGLLLTPESSAKKRKWIEKRAKEWSRWFDLQSQATLHKGENEIKRLKTNIHSGLKSNFPDLFEATEHIDLHYHDFKHR